MIQNIRILSTNARLFTNKWNNNQQMAKGVEEYVIDTVMLNKKMQIEYYHCGIYQKYADKNKEQY